MKKTKEKRPGIPKETQLKLWICSAGRCEFPGCNKLLWKDSLTLKEDNYSNIAHIISWTPTGPRGDEKLSKKLAKDFSNLMLLCQKHAKMIDGRNKADYSVELLREYKTAHEDRIKILTGIQDEYKTTVLRFKANIGERKVEVPISQVHEAILPKYPSDEKGILIDLSRLSTTETNSFWKVASDEIKKKVAEALVVGNDDKTIGHLSIFAMGPIPLLVQLGYVLSNTIPADIYQRHRDADNWKWKDFKDEHFKYKIKKRNILASNKNVALALSLSGIVHKNEVRKALKKDFSLYEITVDNPETSFLQTKVRLEAFRSVYRKVMAEIRATHGKDCTISLFPAIPAPIAVTCGREFIHKADPKMIVFDLNSGDEFVQVLIIK